MNTRIKHFKIWPTLLFFAFLQLIPVREIYCQSNILLVSPRYNVIDAKRVELSQISSGIQRSLKTMLEDLSYKCTSMNFQDWDSFNDDRKLTKLNQYQAKYVISTKQIKLNFNSIPAELVYEVEFVIEELDAEGTLTEVPWYDSRFIVYSLSERNYDKVADNVSEEFNYFHINGQFKPRIKITEYDKTPDSIYIEYEEDFNDWLEELLKNKFQTYVFYDDERIYPGACDNLITGLFSWENTSGQKPVKLIVVFQVDDEKKKSKGFQILNGSEEYLSEDDIDKLVEEIQDKLDELINN